MDKQAWIAITLCIVGLFAWQTYVTSKYPPLPARAAMHAPAPAPAPAPATGAAATAAPGAPLGTSGQPEVVADRKQAAAPTAATAPEQIETVKSDQLVVNFTNLGGGITAAVPQGKQHVAENGVNIQLGHAGNIPIGALSEQPGENANLPYQLTKQGNDTVVAERTEPNGLKIVKEYTLDWQGDPKQIPAIRLKVSLTNTGTQPYKDSGYYVYAGSATPIHRRDLPTYTAFDWMTGGVYHTDHVTSFDAGHIPLVGVETHAARNVITTPLTKVQWIAVKNQFYTTILTPLDEPGPDQEPLAREVWARRIDLPLTPEETVANAATLHGVDVALGLPALDIKPGETVTRNFQIYAGPKFYSRLERLGHNEQEVMDYGKFKLVSITLLALLNTFSKWTGNYAVAIILLTIMVKAILFPLQNKANKSMRRMSALAPLQKELREKYKDDAAKLNTETFKLYKDYGVSPVSGCWPMLIQMPIFFGFLYMLYPAAELRNAGFLWVHDLSQPDTVAHIAGFPINVLPLLMIGTQFWQMSLTPRTGDPQQQKTMMFMPLLFGFFCYNFAAALALYYTMQGLLTILQLYITRSQNPPTLGAGDMTVLKPTSGGKGKNPNFGAGKGGFPKKLKT